MEVRKVKCNFHYAKALACGSQGVTSYVESVHVSFDELEDTSVNRMMDRDRCSKKMG